MVLLIYFGISIIAGIGPALFARQMKRNFILWWIYSALFLPIALIHILIIKLNLQRFMIIIYIVLVAYFLFFFYIIEWYFSTQPLAMREANIVEQKYIVATYIIDNQDDIISGRIKDIQNNIITGYGFKEAEIREVMKDFNVNSAANREYLIDFAVELLKTIEIHFENIAEKAEYQEASVIKGAAESVFINYIDSLKLINQYNPMLTQKYPATDKKAMQELTDLLENNYLSILTTEADFYKTTENAADFISHLEKEIPGAADKDRMIELVDFYEKIGDIFTGNKEKDKAIPVYNQAISLINTILEYEQDITASIDFYIRLADLNDKTGNIKGIVSAFENFMEIFYSTDLYLDKNVYYKLEYFPKLDTAMTERTNRDAILASFINISGKYKPLATTEISLIEIHLFDILYLNLSREERTKYASHVNECYKFLISAKDIHVIQTLNEAYQFFDKYRQVEIKLSYADILEEIIPGLDTFEKTIIVEKYDIFDQEIRKALEIVEQYLVTRVILDKEKKSALRDLNIAVRAVYDRIIDDVTLVSRSKDIIENILKTPVDRTGIKTVQKKIDTERKAFNDIWKALTYEDRILNDDYPDILRDCKSIIKLASEIDSGVKQLTSRNKSNLESMRRGVLNTVKKNETEIKEIKAIKKQVGEKHNTTIPSEKLDQALADMKAEEKIADEEFRKVFPGGLPQDRKADAE